MASEFDNPETLRAEADLESIERLRNSLPFTAYFMRRVKERLEARKTRVLDMRTSQEETTKEKAIIEAIRQDVLNLLDDDERSCRGLLK